jgi:integrase
MTLHQLRHSNLSMMARYMSPFDLQRYAGWSSIEPARIYIHDDLDAVSRAASAAWQSVEVKSNAPEMHQA